ncbi:MAG: hypothetical protein HQL67_13125 [Magnetococcales bacterium]|nr:hypothetical protein [Magnetococcales bacterium]
MIIGVRAKLFFISLILVLSVLLITGLYLEKNLVHWLESRISSELLHTANSGRIFIEQLDHETDLEVLDAYADEMGKASNARITIIDASGRVVGDSHLTLEQVRTVENHGQRPEVLAALQGVSSHSYRFSTTLKTRMLYVGVAYQGRQGNRGVIRAAHSLSEVDATYYRVRTYLALAGLFALTASVAGLATAAHLSTRKLRDLVDKIHTDLTEIGLPLASSHSKDEISGLADSFGSLIEELKESFTLLSSERSRINAVLEGMEEGVVSLDGHKQITLMNHMASRMLNISPNQLGTDFSTLISHPRLNALLIDLENFKSFQIELTLDSPLSRTFLVVGSALPDSPGCILVFQDVTSIRMLEKIRQDFVANVSHELRTPITVIQANAETLVNGALYDHKNGIIIASIIEEEAIRLSKIVSELLDLSRIESKEFPILVEPVPLLPAAEFALYMVQDLAEEKNIRIHVDISTQQQLMADQDALKQVLLNLLENAVKYIPVDSQIQLRSRRTEEGVLLEVVDNGPGIASIHLPRLFERFYRVDKGRSRKLGGTGLGLAITKHLVQRMGGSVGVKPVRPQGTCFWVLLRKCPQ